MKTRAVGAALASAVIISGCEVIPPQKIEEGPQITHVRELRPGMEKKIDRTFDRFKSYWSMMGVGVQAVHLKTITDGEQTTCGTSAYGVEYTYPWNNPTVIDYCFETHTVDISQAGVELLEDVSKIGRIPLSQVFNITEGHELGHAVQELSEGLANGEV